MTVADPYIARKPSVKIGATELICHARKVSVIPEDDMVDVATFCNPGGEAPGSTTWTAEIDVIQSFGDDEGAPSLYGTLYPLQKTQQTFTVLPRLGVAVSPANPECTFEAWVPSIPFIDSEIGKETTFTLTLSVIGEPVFDFGD